MNTARTVLLILVLFVSLTVAASSAGQHVFLPLVYGQPLPTPTPSPPGAPVQIWFQNGVSPSEAYWGVSDTYLRQNWPSPLGAASEMRIQYGVTTNQEGMKPLIKFQIDPGIPAGSVVVEARLYLYVFFRNHAYSGRNASAYRVNRHWDEATATWTVPWGIHGAVSVPWDHESTGSPNTLISNINQWYSWDLTRVVQQWVSGEAANEGILLLLASGTPQDLEYGFYSSDHLEKSVRPKVFVSFRPPASGSVAQQDQERNGLRAEYAP